MQALQYFQNTGGKKHIHQIYIIYFACEQHLNCPVGNTRGIGACENNLSASFLSIGDDQNAERHCNAAIKIAADTLQSIERNAAAAGGGGSTARDLRRAKETLSDRKGNLGVIYLQRNRFVEAFRVLEDVLVQDRSNMYFRGLVVKHGTLGHYYLKQGEIASAERVFLRALDFIRNREEHQDVAWSDEVPSFTNQNIPFLYYLQQLPIHVCLYVCRS